MNMLKMLTKISIFILCLFHCNGFERQNKKEFSLYFRKAITYMTEKVENYSASCPSGFFFNGSCYYYKPSILNGFSPINFNQAANFCNFPLHDKLWDIETVDEFDYVLFEIYRKMDPSSSALIIVNFTEGAAVLNLQRDKGTQNISVGNTTNYLLTYEPSNEYVRNDTYIIIDISKVTKKVKLEDRPRSEQRGNHYICKRKINNCYNNNRCGKNGECKHLPMKYICVCNFMYTGNHCEERSSRGIQSIVGLGLIIFGVFILIFHSVFGKLKDKKFNFMSTIKSHRSSRGEFYSIPNTSSNPLIPPEVIKNPVYSPHSGTLPITSNPPDTIIGIYRSSNAKPVNVKKSATYFCRLLFHYIKRFCIYSSPIFFATFCCYTIYEFKIRSLDDYKKLYNITEENSTSTVCKLFQQELNTYYKVPSNYISLVILFTLIISKFIFENFSCWKKRTFKSCWRHFSVPLVFNSHSHIFRFQSAAVFGIIALEILHVFDKFIMNSTEHLNRGPLIDLCIQFGIGILVGLRYCPILAIFEKENNSENHLENMISYGLGAIYLCCEIIFKVQSDINCAIAKNKTAIINQVLQKFDHLGGHAKQYMITQLGINRTAKLNETYENIRSEYVNKYKNFTDDIEYEADNEIAQLNYSLELNKQSIFYNILRNAPYYYFTAYLCVCLTVLFINKIRNKYKKTISYQSYPRWKYIKCNLLKSKIRFDENDQQEYYSRLFRCLSSMIMFFKEHIYSTRPYFRYSKLIVCLYTSAFTLVYYFTYWIQDHTHILTKKLLLSLNLILCSLADLTKDLCYNLSLNRINQDIKYICLLTAFVIYLQLFFGLKHYQLQMCSAYRGVYIGVPKPKHISSASIISKSVHYPGRFIGSLIYSYGFLFTFVSICYILSRYILFSLKVMEFASKFLLPMLVFFLFQLLFVRLICKLLFVQNSHLLALRNLRLFYTFSYFSFFFDCFLGFLMCLSRITKGIMCTLIFFSRLDYSAYGRGLEMYDSSYASYVSYFHVERIQRHPVLNVFIDMIRERLIDIRKLKYKLSLEEKTKKYEDIKSSQLIRFRWALAYTLIHNEQLKRYRKHRLGTTKIVQSKTLERLFGKMGLTQTLPRKY